MNKLNSLTNFFYKADLLRCEVFFFGLILLLVFLSVPSSSYSVEPRVFDKSTLKRDGESATKKGRLYTWQDGDITRKVWVQPELTVQKNSLNTSRDEIINKSGQQSIVKKQSRHGQDAQPVFRGQSGELRTLPGGVLLVFEPEMRREQIESFFAENGISSDRVSEMNFTKNSFFVKTDAGFASLNLANRLAGEEGVRLSSPNWWSEVTTK